MKLGLHTYSNDKLFIKLEPENDTEKEILNRFFKGGNLQKIEAEGDALNGIFLWTGKYLKDK